MSHIKQYQTDKGVVFLGLRSGKVAFTLFDLKGCIFLVDTLVEALNTIGWVE